jgi:hypothetical protein
VILNNRRGRGFSDSHTIRGNVKRSGTEDGSQDIDNVLFGSRNGSSAAIESVSGKECSS